MGKGWGSEMGIYGKCSGKVKRGIYGKCCGKGVGVWEQKGDLLGSVVGKCSGKRMGV